MSIEFKSTKTGGLLKLEALASVSNNVRENFLFELGSYLEEQTRERFLAKKDAEGKDWAALNPKYLAQKIKQGKGSEILVFEGDMLDSLNFVADSNRLIVGYGKSYAFFHEEGKGSKKRSSLGFNTANKIEAQNIFNDIINGRLGQ